MKCSLYTVFGKIILGTFTFVINFIINIIESRGKKRVTGLEEKTKEMINL